jgi:hypothetical protein
MAGRRDWPCALRIGGCEYGVEEVLLVDDQATAPEGRVMEAIRSKLTPLQTSLCARVVVGRGAQLDSVGELP